MRKKTYTACSECIYENEDYKAAEKKARENNPSLFAKQDALNKEKQAQRRKDNIINAILTITGVIGGLMVAAVAGAMGHGLISQNMTLLTSNPLRVATVMSIVVAMIFMCGTQYHNSSVSAFWSNMDTRDYELYKEEKEEFAKAGCKLP